jgi:integral membrane protein
VSDEDFASAAGSSDSAAAGSSDNAAAGSSDNAAAASRAATRLLRRYRILAFTTATLLIILVFVGIPLQLAAHNSSIVSSVGTLHGFLYLVYLYFAFEISRWLRMPMLKMVLVLLAGTVPFAAFVAERVITREFNAVWAEPLPVQS